MLATSTEGMQRLFKLSSLASLEGYYYKPRMDKELLAEHVRPNVDLIATTGCPSGEIQTYLRMGEYEKAKRSAGEYRDIFGAENFFCELMDHGIGIERRAQKDLIRLAKDMGSRSSRRTTCTTRTPRTPAPTRCCCACSPARR
jgi:DNA polymerase-3 subunit alpha